MKPDFLAFNSNIDELKYFINWKVTKGHKKSKNKNRQGRC